MERHHGGYSEAGAAISQRSDISDETEKAIAAINGAHEAEEVAAAIRAVAELEEEEKKGVSAPAINTAHEDEEVAAAIRAVAELEEKEKRGSAHGDAGAAISSADEDEEVAAAIRAVAELEEAEKKGRGMEGVFVATELKDTSSHSLATVVKALLGALAGEGGVMVLALSCPFPLEDGAQDLMQEMISAWLENFQSAVMSMPAQASEQTTVASLSGALRCLMQVVAIWHADSTHGEIVDITKQWIGAVVVNLTGTQQAADRMNTDRLDRMLSGVSAVDASAQAELTHTEDVLPALLRFGCKEEAVTGLPENVARALFQKLQEWQENKENEIFTFRQLVEDGRLTAGLGLVVREGSSEHSVHIFVYDLPSLCAWVERSHEDPQTRQALNVGEILQIS